MLALTCALAAAAVGGLMFSTTRRIGILCLAGLILLHPWILLVFLAVGGAVIYFIYVR